MTFAEFKTAVKAMAGGRSYSAGFEIMTYEDGGKQVECCAWIQGLGRKAIQPNYESALTELEAIIRGQDESQHEEMYPDAAA